MSSIAKRLVQLENKLSGKTVFIWLANGLTEAEQSEFITAEAKVRRCGENELVAITWLEETLNEQA